MIELAPEQRRALRAAAHHLNPVVSIAAKGLTLAVRDEIDACLRAHELIKVRLYGIERTARDALLAEICDGLNCAPVQHIGNLFVLWREKPAVVPVDATNAATRRRTKPTNKKQAAAANERDGRKTTIEATPRRRTARTTTRT